MEEPRPGPSANAFIVSRIARSIAALSSGTGSAIIWADFFINPSNPRVRPLNRSDVRELFPGWRAKLYRTTLAPPLARRLVGVSWSLARAVEKLKIFNAYFFGFLRRES